MSKERRLFGKEVPDLCLDEMPGDLVVTAVSDLSIYNMKRKILSALTPDSPMMK